jgi:hypothetical protein
MIRKYGPLFLDPLEASSWKYTIFTPFRQTEIVKGITAPTIE